jgi:hypothetical protein
LEWFVIGILRIFLQHGHDHIGRNKAGNIVNMTVSIVAFDSVAQPDNSRDPEVISQRLFDFRLRTVGVSIRIEETRRCCEQCALSVHIDRPTLQYQLGIIDRQFKLLCYLCRYYLIQIIGRIFAAPRIVIPVDDCHSRLFIALNENGPVISAPRLIGWNLEKFDMRYVNVLEEEPDTVFVVMIRHINSDFF